MRITDVKTFILKQPGDIKMIGDGTQDTVLVKVETDKGIAGWGESDTSPWVAQAAINTPASHVVCRGLREIVIGQDPFDIEKIWRDMYRDSYYFSRRGAGMHAISAIDIALWDVIGKAVGLPVHKLLGGRFHDSVPAYASMLMPETEEETAAKAKEYIKRGFRAIKFGWGGLGLSREKDIRLVRAARNAMGKGVRLMLDIGYLWKNSKYAVSMCRALEEFEPYWIEEPLISDDIKGFARLCPAVDTRIASGEELSSLHEFSELIEDGKIDVVQPDISRCGGISVARKLGEMADTHGIEMVPHAFKSGLLMAASIQVIAAREAEPLLEYCSQETVLSKSLLKMHFPLEQNGTVRVPASPGLGVEVDEGAVARYQC